MRRWILVTLALVLAITACTEDAPNAAPDAIGTAEIGTASPGFPSDLDWVNTSSPVSPGDLEGKVVLVTFWRSSCLGCLERLLEMEALAAEFGGQVVVIGVHSAKFPHEADSDAIRTTLQQYQTTGAVVDDSTRQIWDEWGIRAWPTVVVLDHEGTVAGGQVGQDSVAELRPMVEALVVAAPDTQPGTEVSLTTGVSVSPPTVLSFPEAVLVDEPGNRLFIADTGHHRIVVATLDTHEVLAVFGDGTRGRSDGPAATASFAMPRGMALEESTLFVADTGNHLIRTVDLAATEVATVAGTGTRGALLSGESSPLETPLTGPWDVESTDDGLVISLAGANQLALLDVGEDLVRVLAGTGRQGTANGGVDSAEFASPAGIASDTGGAVYVADAESSAIRRVAADGTVDHIAGGTKSLFDFGDKDGSGAEARLQWPLGIAVGADAAWLADTYNSKIKRLDLATGEVETLVGGAGWRDGPNPLFAAPADVELAAGLLYVADRDNHSVRVVDATTGVTSTLILEGIERLVPNDDTFAGSLVTLDLVQVGAGPGTVVLNVAFPPGYKANELAPSRFEWLAEGDAVEMTDGANLSIKGPAFPLAFNFAFSAGTGRLQGDIWLVYCETDFQSICLFDRARIDIPLEVNADGPSDVQVAYEVTLPDGL